MHLSELHAANCCNKRAALQKRGEWATSDLLGSITNGLYYSELQITLQYQGSGFWPFVITYTVLHITTASCICLESGVWWKNPYCTQMKALVSDNKTGSLPALCAYNIKAYYKLVQCRGRNNMTCNVLVESNILWFCGTVMSHFSSFLHSKISR